MAYYPELEICLEFERAVGNINFKENSPDEVEKQNKKYLKKEMGVFL